MQISYSAIKDALECPYRFKLRTIDRIRIFQNSIHTVFGTIMHQCIQNHLTLRLTQDQTQQYFKRIWRKFCGLYRKNLDFELIKQYFLAGTNIIKHIDTQFKDYAVIAIEQEISTPIKKESDVNFKGYIDLLLDEKTVPVIADLKTAKDTKSFCKYLTPIKRYQLVYYQKYFAQQFDYLPEDIKLLFIVLEKDPQSTDPIQFVEFKTSKKDLKNSAAVMEQTLKRIENNDFPKNKTQCYNEFTGIKCPFYKTQYCT